MKTQRVCQPDITRLMGKILIDPRGANKTVRIPQLITTMLEEVDIYMWEEKDYGHESSSQG